MIVQNLTKHEQAVAEYCDAVQSGKRVAGKAERDAVRRYLSDRRRSLEDASFQFRFDASLANASCDFFPLLVHTDGEYAGRPFELYPWQTFIVWNLFGWVRKDTGYRRFKEAFLSVGRGNGKTPFGAALMLLLFACDTPREPQAQVYTAAVKRDQAALSFKAAKYFVEAVPELRSFIDVHKDKMFASDNRSVFLPLSSDAKSADGYVIHGLLRDELHAWKEHQREFMEKLQTALGKRRQPLAVTITTAGSEESKIWKQQYDIAKKCVNQDDEFDVPSLFVFIAEIDEDDDELDEACWPKANPMLEHGIVKVEYLRDLAIRAKEDAAFRHELRRYHCNRLAYTQHRAFTEESWARGADALPDLSTLKNIYVGVDLGWQDDFAAIGYCAPLEWTTAADGTRRRRYAIWADVWIPRGTKRDLSREPFASWIRSGRVWVSESEATDTEPMYQRLREMHAKHKIKSLGYDKHNALEFGLNCVNQLKLKTFAVSQTHEVYHEPFMSFKSSLADGRILHGGDSVLAWSAGNVIEHMAASSEKQLVMPSKKRSGDKIDPFVAVLMAYREALFDERKGPSVFEKRGPIVVG